VREVEGIIGEMPIYSFGPFALDPSERSLTRDGRRVTVPGKAYQILLLLVEAGGRLVTHGTLRAKLWPDVIVEDRTLTVHVSTLRKSMGAGPSRGFIETVSGAGYRLAVPVHRISADADPSLSSAQVPDAKPLVVQPFSTGSVGEGDKYLGVGIADALTTVLGGLPGLTVSPIGAGERVSSASDIVTAARSLGLGQMLEGSVDVKDKRLHVSVRLVDITSGRAQWTEHFEQDQSDAAAVQDAIALRVADSLLQSADLNRAQMRSYRPRSTEAYFLQLQARASLRLFTLPQLNRALTLFRQAIALDPDYALAHAGLASTYLLLGQSILSTPIPKDEAMPLARQAAERALVQDEEVAEAWAVLGRVKMEYERDWDGAEADLAQAIALNPNSLEALSVYGMFLCTMAHHEEAMATMEKARQLDPQHIHTLQHLGLVYWWGGNSERALEVLGESLRIQPNAVTAHHCRILILDQLGRHDEAMADRLVWLSKLPDKQVFMADLKALERTKGPKAAIAAWATMLESMGLREGATIQWMQAGEVERSFDCAERCLRLRSNTIGTIGVSPPFLSMHDHPRMQKILRELGLDKRLRRPAPRNS
jgi:DNA-binding winged helix-turn-helix (wHTH) protein/Tfp pilus assembly protein PilF